MIFNEPAEEATGMAATLEFLMKLLAAGVTLAVLGGFLFALLMAAVTAGCA